MCGIVGIFKIKQQTQELRQKALKMSQKLRHRGPDWSGIYVGDSAILAHERLSIVDPQSGGQPLYSPDRKQILTVNGEIYNHRDVRAKYAGKYDFQTGSDCEVILALYRDKGIHFLEDLSSRCRTQIQHIITRFRRQTVGRCHCTRFLQIIQSRIIIQIFRRCTGPVRISVVDPGYFFNKKGVRVRNSSPVTFLRFRRRPFSGCLS